MAKALLDGPTRELLAGKVPHLGEYSSPVTAAFGAPIKPSLRGKIAINSNDVVNLTHHKPKCFKALEQIGAPLPSYVSTEEVSRGGRVDFTLYDRQFAEAEAVVCRSPTSARVIENYTDLIATSALEQEWEKSVLYERVNDYMYRVTYTMTQLTKVEHRNERRDHVLEVDFQSEHTRNTVFATEMEMVAIEVVQKLQVDFLQVTFEFGAAGFYLVDITTNLTLQTVEAAKAVIRRKVNMLR